MPPRMNQPPEHGIRVPAEAMRRLVTALWERADVPSQDAELMADVLVRCDLRCVFSHGTRQLPHYSPLMLEGQVNPRPDVKVVEESATTLVLDGDGGMGYLPCWRGARTSRARKRSWPPPTPTCWRHAPRCCRPFR